MNARQLLALAVLLPLAMSLSACGKSTDTTPPAAEHHEEEATQDHITLSAAAIASAGIETSPAGPGRIATTLAIPGEIAPNADRLAHIVPRFPGIARAIHVRLGDTVRRDQILAVVESNESLSPYDVRSLTSGTVLERHITLGEFVRDDADIFVIADLSTVWANLAISSRDVERVRVGQQVTVRALNGSASASGRIDYLGQVVEEPTRAGTARVILRNPRREWRPGMFIAAQVVVSERHAAVAIPETAVQQVEGKNIVFVREAGHFARRDVELGASDSRVVEVRSGLTPGEVFVTRGAFILKSELLKSEAGHDH